MVELRELLGASCRQLVEYFLRSETDLLLVIDEGGRIIGHNDCGGRLLAAGRSLIGLGLDSLLLEQSRGFLPLGVDVDEMAVRLNFSTDSKAALPLYCRVARMDGGYLVIGAQPMLTNEQILQKMTLMANEMANLSRDLHRKNRELEEARKKIKVLSGIIPICMHCKEIRDDKGYWNKLEAFITEHSEAHFSHSICDKCVEKYYPELNLDNGK